MVRSRTCRAASRRSTSASALFAAGSIGCALATDIETLIAFRFIQGIGACAGMVIPRAIVRDLHTGVDAARLMSLLMLVFSVSPILAPLAGSASIEWFGWRGVFWAVAVAGAGRSCLVATVLGKPGRRTSGSDSSLRSALAGYRAAERPSFPGAGLDRRLGISSFFVFLANRPSC